MKRKKVEFWIINVKLQRLLFCWFIIKWCSCAYKLEENKQSRINKNSLSNRVHGQLGKNKGKIKIYLETWCEFFFLFRFPFLILIFIKFL